MGSFELFVSYLNCRRLPIKAKHFWIKIKVAVDFSESLTGSQGLSWASSATYITIFCTNYVNNLSLKHLMARSVQNMLFSYLLDT